MANMYDISAGIQQPNIVGNFNQGVQTAQQNQVFGEKQQAYQQALAQQQNINALAPKIIAGDPAATEQAQAIDPAAAANYAPAAAQHLQRISGAIRYIDQQSTPQAKEAAYQNVRPYLAQFGQEPPATFAEAEPKMEQARAQIAALQSTQKPGYINVAAGGALVDPTTGKPVFQNQGVPKTPAIVSVNLPDGSTQQYQHNPDGTLSPLRVAPQGASQGVPDVQLTPNPNAPSVAADQATALVSSGTDPGVAAARAMAMHPGTTLAYDPTSKTFKDVSDGSAQIDARDSSPAQAGISAPDTGQLGRSAPKNLQVTQMTPEEVKARGLPAGTVAQRKPNGQISILSKGDGFNANSPQELGDPTRTGADYLSSIPADTRPTVLAVLQGRQAPPTGSAQKSSYWMGVINAANKIDPTFDTTNYQKRYKTAQDFSPSGASGKQVIALNTMIQHIGELKDAFDNLHNSGSPALNAVLNPLAYQSGLGARGLNDYNLNARTAAQEIESLWKKGAGNAADIEAMTKDLSSSADPGSANKVFAKMATLAAGKLQALKSAYQNGMGNSGVPLQLVTPESLQTMQKIDPDMAATYAQNARALPSGQLAGNDNPTAPSAAPVKQPRAVNSMGHAVVWNGSAWVPE